MKYIIGLSSVLLTLWWGLLTTTPAWAVTQSHAPADAYAYIIEPTDGETVPQTFDVKFGVSGMEIAPAGVNRQNTGHYHLLIDLDELPDLTQPLPSNRHVKHFGNGQIEATPTLPSGVHTLRLLLGDYAHVPHDNPVLSALVHINVE
ncbi:MAG: DUF4399 domain-containing protein [Symploca sp. SIO3E6]|nr:DUF4399 domain-containing protein [Caldora sp. SIO3E6]